LLKRKENKTAFMRILLSSSTEAYLSTPGGPTTLFNLPNHSSHQEQREETTVRKESTVLLSWHQNWHQNWPQHATIHASRLPKGTILQAPTPSSTLKIHHNVLFKEITV
jgi:hypothetical protein